MVWAIDLDIAPHTMFSQKSRGRFVIVVVVVVDFGLDMVLVEICTDLEDVVEHSNTCPWGGVGGILELCNRNSAWSVWVKNDCSSREFSTNDRICVASSSLSSSGWVSVRIVECSRSRQGTASLRRGRDTRVSTLAKGLMECMRLTTLVLARMMDDAIDA
jgi:hypothetical protein